MQRRIAILIALATLAAASVAATPAAAGLGTCRSGAGDGVAVFERAAPSVVLLEGSDLRGSRVSGTGIVWSSDGLIVTNRHVVAGMAEFTAAFHDGRRMPAMLKALASEADIALVRVTGPGGFVPMAAAGGPPRIGEQVFAVGNPYGLGLSLSQGIVSGLGRAVDAGAAGPLEGAIQTDASLNPGNSGGALLDRRGCLLGMNSAILSPSGGSAGIGFALPTPVLARVVDRLLAGGGHLAHAAPRVRHAAEASAPGAGRLGIVASFTGLGMRVDQVEGGSAAQLLGSRVGDLITHVNGLPVRSPADVLRIVQAQPVLRLTILREGRTAELTAG